MFARYPTPARRARSSLVGVLIAGLLGVFAVMSNSAAPATASGANYLGSVALAALRRPVTGMASTPTGRGYWLAADDGGVFSFGDAHFWGSTGGFHINRPVIGITATPNGRGYWLAASDGGIFTFGEAVYYGSTGGRSLSSPIVGIERPRAGRGYWLVARDGAIYPFGQATFLGSGGGSKMLSPTASMASSPGGGYWLATDDGGVYTATAAGQWIIDPHDAGTPEQRISKDVYYRTNAERRARRLPALAWDAQLSSLATGWSSTMARSGSFSHRNLSALFGSQSYSTRYRTLEENIFEGNGSFGTAGAAHVAFMSSASHRAAMLNSGLTSLGVGAYCSGGTLYVTQDFGTWVSRPAPPAGAIPPATPIVRPDYRGVACP